jgi:hypothetical protein
VKKTSKKVVSHWDMYDFPVLLGEKHGKLFRIESFFVISVYAKGHKNAERQVNQLISNFSKEVIIIREDPDPKGAANVPN